jgi:hypothetical protein
MDLKLSSAPSTSTQISERCDSLSSTFVRYFGIYHREVLPQLSLEFFREAEKLKTQFSEDVQA